MNKLKRNFNRTKDKFVGVIKQTAGKVTGDDVLELKGRMQSTGADLQKKSDVGDGLRQLKKSAGKKKVYVEHKFNQVQQRVAQKINDSLDERAQRKSK